MLKPPIGGPERTSTLAFGHGSSLQVSGGIMNLRHWPAVLSVFLGFYVFFALILRPAAAALIAALLATVLIKFIATRRMNVGGSLGMRIVGPDSGWYWIFLVLFAICLPAVVITARK
ncbi:MAG: hypothetical protein NTV51_30715 [Verrucomicrobia bacterium]|nr:hypothetical protein [Verrucomicrobiota bacterium]